MRGLLVCVALTSLGCVSGQTSALIDETLRSAPLRAHRGDGGSAGATAQPDPDLSGALRREAVVALAVARDPGLAARAHRVQSMLHAARAEGSLPAPSVSFEVWNLPAARPYALGDADMYMVNLRQMFPAPGMLDAEARAMTEDARVEVGMLASRERDVARRASEAYADYVGAWLHHHVHHEHLGFLEAMLSAARARLVTGGKGGGGMGGGGAFVDATRLESEQARHRRALARYQTDMARARATLNALLLRAPAAPLGPPADVAAETVDAPLDALVARALAARGMIAEARARVRAAGARADAARAAATWPEFMVSLGYFQDPHMEPGVGGMFSMTLPWLWGGARARVAAARSREAAERAEVRGAEAATQGEIATAYAEMQGRARELAVVRGDELPAMLRAVEATRAAYVTGGASLLSWLDATRMVLDVRMMEADLVMELGRAVAMLEEAVGAALPRVPVTVEREGAR